jgi:pimeloyl-ACP methyl ester carboxylesterase
VRASPSAEVERVSIATRAGRSIDASVVEGKGRARGTILFAPALGASSRAFWAGPSAGPVGLLTGAGWRAVLFDLGGHDGEAGAPPSASGSFDANVRGDLAATAETLRERFDGPLVLVGHGFGGLAACAAAGVGALAADALVLFGVNPWLPRLDPSPLRRLVKASLLAHRAGAGPIGQAVQAALAWPDAPLRARFWPEASRWWAADAWLDEAGNDYLAAMRDVRCPTLVFSSRADRLFCAPDCAHGFASRLGASRLEHHVVSGPGHWGLATSEGAAPLWQRSAAWLARLGVRSP